jgi:hypothetical protein
LAAHNRRDYEGQKGKSINVNYWWNMGDTSTESRYFINDWYLGQIHVFSLYKINVINDIIFAWQCQCCLAWSTNLSTFIYLLIVIKKNSENFWPNAPMIFIYLQILV